MNDISHPTRGAHLPGPTTAAGPTDRAWCGAPLPDALAFADLSGPLRDEDPPVAVCRSCLALALGYWPEMRVVGAAPAPAPAPPPPDLAARVAALEAWRAEVDEAVELGNAVLEWARPDAPTAATAPPVRSSNAQPMQPVEFVGGVARFRKNAVVVHLLAVAHKHGCTLNDLETMGFPRADHEQLAQLIGYSVSGFGDLEYADRATVALADAEVERLAAAKGGVR